MEKFHIEAWVLLAFASFPFQDDHLRTVWDSKPHAAWTQLRMGACGLQKRYKRTRNNGECHDQEVATWPLEFCQHGAGLVLRRLVRELEFCKLLGA